MELIIDIDENLYSYISKEDAVYFPDDGGKLFEAVKNGTPLEEKLEKIKKEISEITFITTAHSVNARGMAFTDSINKIIDEHISTLKGESK